MAKSILSGKKLREKLLSGVEQLAGPVTATMGPRGRNIGIEKMFIENTILHDGVSVAREIILPDSFENFSAQVVRQVAEKTVTSCGDGTSSSTLLSHEIIKEGFKLVDGGTNPMGLKNGLQKAGDFIVSELKKEAKTIGSFEEIKQIATISSADEKIGETIAKAIEKVGKYGVVSVAESSRLEMEVEYKMGMEYDKGYISPMFCNPGEDEVNLVGPNILVTDHVISNAHDMSHILEKIIAKDNRAEVVIVASDITGSALSTLIINKERGGVDPVGIFAPGFAQKRTELLKDLAICVGATFISKDKQMKLDDPNIADWVGSAQSVWADKGRVKFIGGNADKEKIVLRANLIKEQMEKEESEYEKQQLRERLARLTGGAAVIKVGATTELEMKETKERVIDAVEASKSAMEQGIVAGGGVALFQLRDKLKEFIDKNLKGEELLGANILLQTLSAPINKIISNAGLDSEEIIGKIKEKNTGFDVATMKYGNMFEMGVIDPVKVTINAVSNSISIASLLITTEFVICDIPEKKI